MPFSAELGSSAMVREISGLASREIERAVAHLSVERNAPPGAKSEPVAKAVIEPLPAAPTADAPVKEPVNTKSESEATEDALAKAFAEDAEAEHAAAEAAQAKPETTREPNAALARAAAFEGEGRALRALEVLRAAAAEPGAGADVLSRLTRALMKTGAWGEALRVAERWRALDPSADARLELARVERAMGNRERAVELVKEVLKDPDAPAEAKALLRTLVPGDRVALRD
jgi:tetratricopeptide (TPR) repeat protein